MEDQEDGRTPATGWKTTKETDRTTMDRPACIGIIQAPTSHRDTLH